MSERWLDLQSTDRMAQVGNVLVEQAGMALLSDAYKFPQVTEGHIQSVTADGVMKVDGPFNEYVKTAMMFKTDDRTSEFGTWNHTEIVDLNGRPLSKVDMTNMGVINPFSNSKLSNVLLTGKLNSHTDFWAPDGSKQFSLDGWSKFDPKDFSPGGMKGNQYPDLGTPYATDTTNTISDPKGNYLGEFHLVARQKDRPNVLGITATFMRSGTYMGDVEAVLTVDPAKRDCATFQITRKYAPPPPPAPEPKKPAS